MATNQALMVVLITAAAAAISGAIGGLIAGGVKGFLAGLILPPIGMVIGYYLWAYLTYYIGVNLFGGTADVGEMLRTIGFAHTPRVLGIVGFIPCLGWIISFIGSVWALVASVIAVRQALDFDTGKAIATCIIGWIVAFILTFVVAAIFGIGAAGISAIAG